MAPNMPAELVCAALRIAIQQRQPAPGLIVHFDCGSQYASDQYEALLAKHGFVCSMSRKGNCWERQCRRRTFLLEPAQLLVQYIGSSMLQQAHAVGQKARA